jgi:hypothetical protein
MQRHTIVAGKIQVHPRSVCLYADKGNPLFLHITNQCS